MTAIVCVSQSWGIGRDGALLFRISADHKRFRTLTVGKTVILGHKTLDTFPVQRRWRCFRMPFRAQKKRGQGPSFYLRT